MKNDTYLRFLRRRGFWLAGLTGIFVSSVNSENASAYEFYFIQSLINPQLIIERNYRMRTTLRDVVTGRLAPENDGQNNTSTQNFAVVPTAASENPLSGYSWWLDGTYTNVKDTFAPRAYNSDQHVISTGVDRRLNERLLAGITYSYSGSDTDNFFTPGNSTAKGHHIGAYIGATVASNIVFDTSFLYNFTKNKVNGGGAFGAYDSEGWVINANLTGFWFFGSLTVTPTTGISYGHTRDDAYIDSVLTIYPSQLTRTGTLSFGATFTYSMNVGDQRTIDPFVAVSGQWDFTKSISPGSPPGPVDNRRFDARVEAGVEFKPADNVSVSVKGSVSGLPRKRYRSLSGGGRVSVSF